MSASQADAEWAASLSVEDVDLFLNRCVRAKDMPGIGAALHLMAVKDPARAETWRTALERRVWSAGVTSRQIDSLLGERARIIAQKVAVEGHLYRAEALLHQCGRLLRQLIADSPHNNAARATLLDELHEFLTESRPHPGSAVGEVPGASGKDALPSSTATRVGEWGGD